ncbi:hypothetical protein L7F22_008568 [Adiantum nelumboides]|nr:hypothetical protein [Adiantum nelumboides]
MCRVTLPCMQAIFRVLMDNMRIALAAIGKLIFAQFLELAVVRKIVEKAIKAALYTKNGFLFPTRFSEKNLLQVLDHQLVFSYINNASNPSYVLMLREVLVEQAFKTPQAKDNLHQQCIQSIVCADASAKGEIQKVLYLSLSLSLSQQCSLDIGQILSAGILARRSVAPTARAVCPRLFSLLPQPEKPLNWPIRQYISSGLFPPAAWATPSSVAAPSAATSHLLRPAQTARPLSGATPAVKEAQQDVQNDSTVTESTSNKEPLEVSDYWGIMPKQSQRREDGSPWPWHCFRPADTYTADVAIDVDRHYPMAKSWVDRVVYWTVRGLRGPVDLFFKERHVSHALLLETVAGVPGMLLHLRSLRHFEQSGGWIKARPAG